MTSIIDRIKAYRDKHKVSLKEATDAIRAEEAAKMPRVGYDLIAAYQGVYEDSPDHPNGEPNTEWALEKIRKDTPKQRLDTYLQWNGILGWTNRIWELSQGEL
jgi:hypothetical protein